MSDKRKVVITGMGVVTGLGFDTATLWQNMMEGCCGIRNIEDFDVSDYKTPYGCLVDNSNLESALKRLNIKPLERTVDMAMVASDQALVQAGLMDPGAGVVDREMAVVFGTAVGSTHGIYKAYTGFAEKGLRGLRPTTVPRCMANVISSQISIRYRLTGPNYVMVSACASSTLAIGNAFRMIRDGYVQQALCGGSDAIFEPASFGSWNNLGVMSRNPDPVKACRPFDADRDGCVLGEGAGALVIESYESAVSRKARILAEILGYGESSDASHITSPSPEGQARAIKMALETAGVDARDIRFINAHGTATRANDTCECKSIKQCFGAHTDRVPVASNKSFFGHMLGASGATETVVTVLGLNNGKVPGNLNLDNPDPGCELNFVGGRPMEISAGPIMKNSFGFGGNNAVLIIGRGII